MLRVRLVLWYIGWCVLCGTRPWRYFQLNAPWFNADKRLFSKLDMDQLIPRQWRLWQQPLAEATAPPSYPLFLKPEWGQNARGIQVARDAKEYARLRQELMASTVPYLAQEAARGRREFEAFYIRHSEIEDQAAVFSITETLNNNTDWPVNGILNPDTRYRDVLSQLSPLNQHRIWRQLDRLGKFRIARIGLRADAITDLPSGDFQIIEINLFVPLPLCLLDKTQPAAQRRRFVRESMYHLAQATRTLPNGQRGKAIFWPMLLLNYRI